MSGGGELSFGSLYFLSLHREIEVLRRVEHSNVVKVYEAIESSHKFYIVMEIAHTDLLQLLQKEGPIAEKEARRVFRKIIRGVEYCHKKGEGERVRS